MLSAILFLYSRVLRPWNWNWNAGDPANRTRRILFANGAIVLVAVVVYKLLELWPAVHVVAKH